MRWCHFLAYVLYVMEHKMNYMTHRGSVCWLLCLEILCSQAKIPLLMSRFTADAHTMDNRSKQILQFECMLGNGMNL